MSRIASPSAGAAPVGVAQLSFWFPHANGFCATAQARTDVDLRVVWDSDGERGAERARSFGTAFEPELDAVLARRDIHAVCICAEPFRQAELAEAAAAAGKDIVIEKPMAGSLSDAARIVRAVRRHRVRLLPAFNLRWQPAALLMKSLLDEGAVGDVVSVRRLHGHYHYAEAAGFDYDTLVSSGTWGDPVKEQRSSLFYVASHAALWYVWMLGSPTSLVAEATAVIENNPVEDTSVVVMKYGADRDHGRRVEVIATMESGVSGNASPAVAEIHGTEGTLVLHRGSLPSVRVWNPVPQPLGLFSTKSNEWSYPAVPPQFMRHETTYGAFDVFLDAIVNDTALEMSEVDGYNAIAILTAAEQALDTGSRTKVSSWGDDG